MITILILDMVFHWIQDHFLLISNFDFGKIVIIFAVGNNY